MLHFNKYDVICMTIIAQKGERGNRAYRNNIFISHFHCYYKSEVNCDKLKCI